MVEPEETKQCKNCERMIEISKHRMHEVQCFRMNYKCKICGEVVAKADKEEHEAEAHVMTQCQYCPFKALKNEFGRHEENCDMRPKVCEYCGETFKVERYFDHKEKCGSQTKKCDGCGRFIMNKNREWHLTKGECEQFQNENK